MMETISIIVFIIFISSTLYFLKKVSDKNRSKLIKEIKDSNNG